MLRALASAESNASEEVLGIVASVPPAPIPTPRRGGATPRKGLSGGSGATPRRTGRTSTAGAE
jgi:hypothetical protein